MPWSISLCVYKSPSRTDVGHAFIIISGPQQGNMAATVVYAAAGLSPGQLPESLFDELKKVVPGPGKIYSEWDSLDNEYLRKKTWDIAEDAAIRVLNKINQDRQSNVGLDVPDGDDLPAHSLVKRAHLAEAEGNEHAGGPKYALAWSNCITYAIKLVELAGIHAGNLKSLINTPARVYSMLEA